MEHFQSWSDLVNPEFYIKLGGYWLVLFIIFAETGLFVGFFLPGDSLLFISGIYAVPMVRDTFGITGSDLLDTTIIASSISLAAIIGNMVSYWFGRRSGHGLYERKDSFFFKRKYLLKAHVFYSGDCRNAPGQVHGIQYHRCCSMVFLSCLHGALLGQALYRAVWHRPQETLGAHRALYRTNNHRSYPYQALYAK